ncbi:MAG TPA: hypothetical protein VFM63_04240 [Pyrinomonadaceae bacterium]|nr:hypothetical protein [Pyrinomonadaceae bacterium]
MLFLRPSYAILTVTVLLAVAGTGSGQCTKKLAEIPAAPELLGFRLGMTKEEIKAHVPQTDFGRTDDFGVSKTTINPYFDPKIDKTKFEGVRSISLDLLDQKLTSLWIGYDENYKAKNVDEFLKLITPSLQLPAAWSSWRSRGQQMRCADFQLIVQMVAGGPSMRILDLAAEETVAVRRQQKEEQDALAAAAPEAPETPPEPEIIADKKSKTYYIGACRPEKEIAETNKIVFKTTDEAEKAGFKLAKNCH